MSPRKIDSTFKFSYSLISNYERWLNSESEYNRYYGNSENPPAFDDFELQSKLQFYASLFKLQFFPEFEKDDTALMLGKEFENLLNNCENKPEFEFKNNKGDIFKVVLNSDFDNLVQNRINTETRKGNPVDRQIKISGVLPNGLNFIGYADEVYDNCLIDIKTTSNFSKSNYDLSLQIPLYLQFAKYPVTRGFYQVTEFYRSKSAGKNEFTMKDTFLIESQQITDKQLTYFSDLCAEILKNISVFEKDLENYSNYYINL